MLVVWLKPWRANRVFHVTLGVVRLTLADVWREVFVFAVVRRWWGRANRSASGRSSVFVGKGVARPLFLHAPRMTLRCFAVCLFMSHMVIGCVVHIELIS